tara:strand:+ start:218 stop:856 length:639 start_codon:yes stop_codon:yes gene_type:complete
MKNRTIWLVRHGIREDMIDASWSEGQERPYDTPLAEPGRRQAEEMGRRLLQETIDHVFASPFTRAMQTVSAVVSTLDQKFKVDPALSEALYPDWYPTDPDLDGQMRMAQLFEHVDPEHEPRAPVSYPESRPELRARMHGLFVDLTERYAGNLLIVGHGGSIHGLCQAVVGEDQAIHTCCCCLIEIAGNGDGWELRRNGADTSHLSVTEESLH